MEDPKQKSLQSCDKKSNLQQVPPRFAGQISNELDSCALALPFDDWANNLPIVNKRLFGYNVWNEVVPIA
jgi:hypothetical protein